MHDLYPVAIAGHGARSRRISYISPAAAQNSSYRRKKSTRSTKVATFVAEASRDTPSQLDQSRPPRRRPAASLPAMFCNAMEDIINAFMDPPGLRPWVDPRNVLSSNFAPVDELPPTPCPVVRGTIPRCLAGGAYIRNGPNPQHPPRGPYHLLDGDGMLHSLLLPTSPSSDPVLCCRYVETYKYLLERDAGEPVLPNIFSSFHGVVGLARVAVSVARVLTGQMNPVECIGLANTSLAIF